MHILTRVSVGWNTTPVKSKATTAHYDWMIWWMAALTSGDSERVTSFIATLRCMSMPKETRASA